MSKKQPKIMQQYGVRWPTGVVFSFASRADAERILDQAREEGRDGTLVVHEGIPGRPEHEWTAWQEVGRG